MLCLGFGLTTDDLGFPHRMAPEPLMSVQASCSPAMGATSYERPSVWGTAESRQGGGVWAVSGAVGADEKEAGPGAGEEA
jgi:hypothetical protein